MTMGIGAVAGAPAGAGFTARLLDAGAGLMGAVASTGAPRGAPGTTSVAPGPAMTRFTFKLLSGSIMTRAYSLPTVTCSMSSRSGAC